MVPESPILTLAEGVCSRGRVYGVPQTRSEWDSSLRLTTLCKELPFSDEYSNGQREKSQKDDGGKKGIPDKPGCPEKHWIISTCVTSTMK